MLFNWIAGLSLIGTAASFYLTKLHFDLHGGRAAFASMCNLGRTMNCDSVASSRWAEIVPGVPLSSLTLGYFIALFVLALMAKNKEIKNAALTIMKPMATFSLFMSVFYGLIMFSVLKTGCLFCLLIDVVNICNFLLLLKIKPEASDDLAKGPVIKKLAMTTLGIVAGMALLAQIFGRDPSEASQAQDIAAVYQNTITQVPLTLQTDNAIAYLGPKDAPVTIVEFSDFQCPHCRLGAHILKVVLARYPTQVRMILKGFPLDPKCNRVIEHQGHPVACDAAKANWCVAKLSGSNQEPLESSFETLFEEQDMLSAKGPVDILGPVLQKYAIDAGAIKACIDGKESMDAVLADVEEGIKNGVQATPTFYINGLKVEGPMNPSFWFKVIDHLLEKK